MNFILWIIFGAVAGWIAAIISGRNAQMGALANIVVGIFGAIIGGFIMNAFGAAGVTGFNLTSLIVAILGALVLLFVVGLVRRSSTDTPTKSSPEIRASISPKAQPKEEPRVSSPLYESKYEAPKRETQSPSAPAASRSASPKIQPKKESGDVPKRPASKTPTGGIFISYRRTDSAHVAGRIYDRLVGVFGTPAVFKDVDSIPLGFDFKEYLDEKVGECNVLLALIGDRWLDAKDGLGNRRLEDPTDFVRIEIESALARNIPVIPLLVGGAPMPSAQELPDSLRKLVFRNGIPIRPDPDFHRDMDRLISALKGHV
jgi:uncharacterized membrane protein YeaQ/YmgE (transglycosylase-associated protein family)